MQNYRKKLICQRSPSAVEPGIIYLKGVSMVLVELMHEEIEIFYNDYSFSA